MRDKNTTSSLVESLATDTKKEASRFSYLPRKIERYGKAKNKALAISDYIKNNQPEHLKISNSISDCGNYLVFRNYHTIDEVRLTNACFCKKHLLCPLCAIRRGSKLLSRYLDRFSTLNAENPKLKAYLVTFTVKDGEDLKERFKHLQNSLQSYHKRRHGKRNICEAKNALGSVWSYEIKRGSRSKLWHPHAHCVWLCEEEPSQINISEEWHKITKDSFIVDVRPISQEEPITGFLEVFKYAIKFSDQPEADTWHCFETLRGLRLIGSFGLFYGIPEPDDLTDDPLEGLPYEEYFFRFVGDKYIQKSVVEFKKDQIEDSEKIINDVPLVVDPEMEAVKLENVLKYLENCSKDEKEVLTAMRDGKLLDLDIYQMKLLNNALTRINKFID